MVGPVCGPVPVPACDPVPARVLIIVVLFCDPVCGPVPVPVPWLMLADGH